jgi:DNA polymerase I-like protein with 3'-5' exonuclease and polymerase domains
MERVVIELWEQLRMQVQSILERINADSALAIAAAANPILALEELGFDIHPAALDDVEARFRFRPRTAVRVKQLRDEIYRHAGRRFDLNSANELATVLFDRLSITLPGYKTANTQLPVSTRGRRGKLSTDNPSHDEDSEGEKDQPRPDIDLRPLVRIPGSTEGPTDPLAVLAGAHPIIELLIEYRRLDASVPRLAPRLLYDDLRSGKRRVPIIRLVARLKGQP